MQMSDRVGDFLARILRRVKNLRLLRWIRSDRYLLLYTIDAQSAEPALDDDGLSCNRIKDIKLFEQTERWLGRDEFVAEAERRIANGEKLYTSVFGSRLVHYGWMIPEQKESWFPFVRQKYRFPVGSAVLYNAYTHPVARGTGLHQRSMRRRIFDAASQPGTRCIYTAIESGNHASRTVAAHAGFRCTEVLYERIRFGRIERGSMSPEAYFRDCERLREHYRRAFGPSPSSARTKRRNSRT